MGKRTIVGVATDIGYAGVSRLDPEARPNWVAQLLIKIKGREWWTPFVDKPGLKRELTLWSTGLTSGAPFAVLVYYLVPH